LLSAHLMGQSALGQGVAAKAPIPTAKDAASFANPLLPSGADPWVTLKDGYYYYMHTTGKNLTLWRTRDVTDLKRAPHKVIWTPPNSGPYSRDVWAPEIHFLEGKWYVYFAADAGTNRTHRIWVIENPSPNPLSGHWTLKGKVSDATDRWAIDPSVFEDRGRLYMIWSGWEGDKDGVQSIYLARMKNPWTIESSRVRISTPEYPWEKIGDLHPKNPALDPVHVDVNEGPEILRHDGNIFLVYSASGCWTDDYALGELVARADSNLLDPAAWKKSAQPVFQQSPAAGVYAPGHNSFFVSPDGKENWILYHANSKPGQGCGELRSPRTQPFTWNSDGTPNFGTPVAAGKLLARPSR